LVANSRYRTSYAHVYGTFLEARKNAPGPAPVHELNMSLTALRRFLRFGTISRDRERGVVADRGQSVLRCRDRVFNYRAGYLLEERQYSRV
jgi:hypothetical protein